MIEKTIAILPWWVLQVGGAFFVFTSHIVNREIGLCLKSYLYYCVVSIFLSGWMLPLSYQKAPSFFQPWFLGLSSLTIAGVLGSLLWFHEAIQWYNWLGAGLSVIGCILLGL